VLRLKNPKARQRELWEIAVPDQLLELSGELATVDRILDDERFFEPFRQRFHTKEGRPSVPVEVYLRLMYLKTRYGLGYETLVKEVADSLSWRTFCRLSLSDVVPNSTTLIKLTKKYGPEVVKEVNQALLHKAQAEKVVKARKLRVDTTVVEADIAHPTDAGLLAAGMGKLTRVGKRVQATGVATGAKLVDRSRSVKKRLSKVGNILRQRGKNQFQEIDKVTRELLGIAGAVTREVRVIVHEALQSPGGGGLAQELNQTLCLVERVMAQARQVIAGNRVIPDRMVSIHDPGARPIKKGSLRQPVQFGRKVVLAECDKGFITAYGVHTGNPGDSQLLGPVVEEHVATVGRVPREIAADRGMSARQEEAKLEQLGVERVGIPRRGKKSKVRQEYEQRYWFRRLKRWRSGIEARIGLLKRRYGLRRSRYRGLEGTQVWVGMGIFAHNLERMAGAMMKT